MEIPPQDPARSVLQPVQDPDQQIGRCRWCGNDLVQPEHGRRRIYCRDRCRKDAYDARQVANRIAAAVEDARTVN